MLRCCEVHIKILYKSDYKNVTFPSCLSLFQAFPESTAFRELPAFRAV